MAALAAPRVENSSQGRAADERAADGRKAAPGGLAASIRVAELRTGDPATRSVGSEIAQESDRVRRWVGVRIRDHDELTARFGDASIDVRAEPARPGVFNEPGVRRQVELDWEVRHHGQLSDLGRESGQAVLESGIRLVCDNDGGDAAHTSSR